MKTQTKLYDKETKQYIIKWLSKKQFETLPSRYCLPYEVEEWNKQQ